MSKDIRINEFFNVFKKLKIENPNIYLNRDTVYYALTRFGAVSNDKYLLSRDPAYDKIIKKENLFNHWIENFKNSSNRVHVDPSWNYFCQFEYGNLKYNNNGEFIKIYVPIDYPHIELAANKIFKFIEQKGIKHVSKIGSDIRMDNIVIRVEKKEDADSIINFINNDTYIQKGLIKPNPFAFNKDGIALACDGDDSYNNVLSVLLTCFMNNTKHNYYNAENFYKYLNNLSLKFENKQINIDQFIKYHFGSSKPEEKDFKRILRLIINSHDNAFTYKDFLNHFRSGLNVYNDFNIENSLFNAINTMSKKYDLKHAILGLNDYINTGNKYKITRLDALRSKIDNSNFRLVIMSFMKKNNLNFISFCYNTLEKFKNIDDNIFEEQKKVRI